MVLGETVSQGQEAAEEKSDDEEQLHVPRVLRALVKAVGDLGGFEEV